jgi:hypothetical protein
MSNFGTSADSWVVNAYGNTEGRGGTTSGGGFANTGDGGFGMTARGFDPGNGATGSASTVTYSHGPIASGGGGGGGGINTSNTVGNGANVRYQNYFQFNSSGNYAWTQAFGGTTGGTLNGGTGATSPFMTGIGGGGGASSTTVAAGDGGAGTNYGGGGGGGGASANGNNSGAGGAGAGGIVRVVSW